MNGMETRLLSRIGCAVFMELGLLDIDPEGNLSLRHFSYKIKCFFPKHMLCIQVIFISIYFKWLKVQRFAYNSPEEPTNGKEKSLVPEHCIGRERKVL